MMSAWVTLCWFMSLWERSRAALLSCSEAFAWYARARHFWILSRIFWSTVFGDFVFSVALEVTVAFWIGFRVFLFLFLSSWGFGGSIIAMEDEESFGDW